MREATDGAIDDAFELASYAQILADVTPDIYEKYFPKEWVPQVIDIFKQIVPDAQSGEQEGGPLVGSFFIIDDNYNPDICNRGGEAYTDNRQRPADSGVLYDYSQTYICPATFNEVLEKGDGPAPRRADLECDDFKFAGSYRMANEMNYIGATIFHEMMHSNLIVVVAFKDVEIPGRGVLDNMIVDDGGYGPFTTRKLLRENPEATKRNADSYTWCAMEVLWTMLCSKELQSQGGRFVDAVAD
ncbi:hypothetical protein BU16DRAFT_564346 [Lophium mytilinum]|uniref:Lysine-specific metallo-endopeptidase domain-containing protein n=1 Tax=Lophium mytilinum TaxID=390894 RepID=A0A6A6QL42_9PEZI|nr:hypothetical protein BU16DRAFT_564346 [Lophium mytilinum]